MPNTLPKPDKSFREKLGCVGCLGPVILFATIVGILVWLDESRLGPLQRAARAGDVTKVHALLGKGYDINGRYDPKGMTALEIAADYAQVDVVRALLDAHADVNTQVFYGDTPLHLAAGFHGKNRSMDDHPQRTQIAQMLLEHGANPNAVNMWYYTALHTAVISMNPEMVRLLLKYGADPAIRNAQGDYPIDRVDHQSSKLYPKEAHAITTALSGWSMTAPAVLPTTTH